jgi:Tfp pilus assembly protein PilN
MKDIGNATLFPAAPLVPEKPEQPINRRVVVPYVADDFRDAEEQALRIKTAEQFIAIRRLKVRSRCPDSVAPWLATLAVSHLVRAANAKSMLERSQQVKVFLLLPTMFLPVNAPRSRVEMFLRRGKAFRINK